MRIDVHKSLSLTYKFIFLLIFFFSFLILFFHSGFFSLFLFSSYFSWFFNFSFDLRYKISAIVFLLVLPVVICFFNGWEMERWQSFYMMFTLIMILKHLKETTCNNRSRSSKSLMPSLGSLGTQQ